MGDSMEFWHSYLSWMYDLGVSELGALLTAAAIVAFLIYATGRHYKIFATLVGVVAATITIGQFLHPTGVSQEDIDKATFDIATACVRGGRPAAECRKDAEDAVRILTNEGSAEADEALEDLAAGRTTKAETVLDSVAKDNIEGSREKRLKAAKALYSRAVLEGRTDLPTAAATFREALAIYEEIGDQPSTVVVLLQISLIEIQLGNMAEAKALAIKALAISEELGDGRRIASSSMMLGIAYVGLENPDEAEAFLKRAVELYEETGGDNKAGIAICLDLLGAIEASRGNFDKAEAFYLRALNLYEETGNKVNMARVNFILGAIALKRDELEKAKAYFEQARELSKETDNQARFADASYNLGLIAIQQGDPTSADVNLGQALDIYEETGNKSSTANTLLLLSLSAVMQSDLDKAQRLAERALVIFEETGDTEKAALASNVLKAIIAEREKQNPDGNADDPSVNLLYLMKAVPPHGLDSFTGTSKQVWPLR